MAHTDIHPIRTTLSAAIAYIMKPEKTANGLYINSYGCSLDSKKAAKEFLNVRRQGTGRGDVLAQHMHISFAGDEVTPEEAMKLGEKLAERYLKGQYQYVIATHIDTNNVHCHIVFNNVSFEHFRTFETKENRGKKSWKNLRKEGDEICKENGLSVIENPETGKGKCYYEWQQDKFGKSWKSKLRYVIDETIMQSSDFDDFLKKIREKNIECVYTPQNHIKIKFHIKGHLKKDGRKIYSRGKTLGWYYDEPQIRRRIEQYNLLKNGVSGRTYRTKIIDTSQEVFQTYKGLLHWADLENMKEASKLINFLTTHNLSSEQELDSTATATYNKRMILVAKLNKLQQQIDDKSDIIGLLRGYKKYKPIYDEYAQSKNKRRYKKDNAFAIEKYESIVEKMIEMFGKTIPNISNLERERAALIEQRKQMNEEYKSIVEELKEIEYAQTSINEYMKTISANKSKENEIE